MKKLKTTLVAAGLAIACTGLSYADMQASTSNTGSNGTVVLLQRGAMGVLKASSGNNYILTIQHVSPYVMVIPVNLPSGQNFAANLHKWSEADYVAKAWGTQGPFTVATPNAGLIADNGSQSNRVALQLQSAQYNAAAHEFTYTVKVLGGNSINLAGQKLYNITLFIDGMCGGNAACESMNPINNYPPM